MTITGGGIIWVCTCDSPVAVPGQGFDVVQVARNGGRHKAAQCKQGHGRVHRQHLHPRDCPPAHIRQQAGEEEHLLTRTISAPCVS